MAPTPGATFLNRETPQMAATIFVWRPVGVNVGHASLSVGRGTYISWWPSDEHVLDSPAQSSGMRADKGFEGHPGPPRNPDYASAPITGLDEDRIVSWWAEMSGRRPDDNSRSRHEPLPAIGRFKLLGANCSNMVARALLVGGLPQRYPLAAAILATNALMTPLLMIDVAEAITGDLMDKAKSAIRSATPLISAGRTAVQYSDSLGPIVKEWRQRPSP
ncbi:MAG: hypothetical protein ACXWZ7_17635 [Gemmatirosa sp.]